jgi:hypothetical protein
MYSNNIGVTDDVTKPQRAELSPITAHRKTRYKKIGNRVGRHKYQQQRILATFAINQKKCIQV